MSKNTTFSYTLELQGFFIPQIDTFYKARHS